MTRAGVFLCTCDDQIGQSIDVAAVARALNAEAIVASVPHVCLPDGLADLQRRILTQNLERVVVAACPVRFQEKRLCEACVEAGVNVASVALVDWREGCAWAHHGDREGATAQALALVRMGLARAENALPLDGVMLKIAPHALVIGGGIAGMTAARTLADRGIPATLVERGTELGGQLRGMPLDGLAATYETTIDAALNHPHIQVLLNSRIRSVDGKVGNYRVVVANSSETHEISAGAIVVTTGAQEYRNAQLYGYDGRRVLTLRDFETQFRHSSPTIGSAIVYILCAGSRDEHIPYCSNVCCLGALNQALRVKRANPLTNVAILFRDLYLLGDDVNEEVVREARRAGVEFVHYAAEHAPRVDADFVVVTDTTGITRWLGYDRIVLATPLVPRDDAGTIAHLLHLTRDQDGFFLDPHLRLRPEQQSERGIFVAGAAHHPVDADTAMLQGMTAAARAARWIREREVMRPASSAVVNPQICTGCAQCVEACAFGAIEMRTPTLTLTRQVGEDVLDRATIDPFLCLACGNCVVACPSKAIDLPTARDAQIFAQIEAALGGWGDKETRKQEDKEMIGQTDALHVAVSPGPRVLVFACQWSGFAAMELAGARQIKYSASVRVIELPCSARLDPLHVLYAFLNGADAVALALCPPNECHFGNGNRFAEARIENLRAQLAAHGIAPQRLQVVRMMGDDAGAWVKAVEQLTGRRLQITGRIVG
jgi:heterodisulfide reductase subunit A2